MRTRRPHRAWLLAALVALAPVLSACADDFDLDKLDVFGLNKKKPLPGDRKPLFPNGVPGVEQGIPPEYMKGYQEEQAKQAAAAAAAQPAPEEKEKKTAAVVPAKPKPKPKARPKPKPKTVAQPAPQPAAQSQPQPAWPAPGQPQPQQGSAAPWPDQGQSQGQAAPWPSAPAPGTFSR